MSMEAKLPEFYIPVLVNCSEVILAAISELHKIKSDCDIFKHMALNTIDDMGFDKTACYVRYKSAEGLSVLNCSEIIYRRK